jgi:hypothetical protein
MHPVLMPPNGTPQQGGFDPRNMAPETSPGKPAAENSCHTRSAPELGNNVELCCRSARSSREKARVENNEDTAVAESPSPHVRRNSRRDNEFIEAFRTRGMILAAASLIAQLIIVSRLTGCAANRYPDASNARIRPGAGEDRRDEITSDRSRDGRAIHVQRILFSDSGAGVG